MKVLITTGHSTACIQTIWSLMQAYGIAQAAPAQFETNDPSRFHQKLYAAKNIVEADQTGQIQPGRMWQNQAENLLIQNLDSPIWGWEDTRSSRLLDFWAEVDQSTFFVLLYVAPEAAFAKAAGPDLENADTSIDWLASWRRKNSELLDFYSRNRERCLLINSDSLIARPDYLAELLADRIGITAALKNPSTQLDLPYSVSALGSIVARYKLHDSEATLLYEELETASDLPTPPDYIAQELSRAWLENSHLSRTKDALIKSNAEMELIQNKLSILESEFDKAIVEIKTTNTREQAGAQEKASLTIQLNEIKSSLDQTRVREEQKDSENDLLLLQLHQIQDELELYYIQLQEKDAVLRQSSQSLEAKQDELSRLNNKVLSLEMEKQSSSQEQTSLRKSMMELDTALNQARQQIEVNRTRYETEIISLRNQLQKSVAELEDSRKTIIGLEKEISKAEYVKQSMDNQVSELRDRNVALDQAIEKSDKEIKDKNQKNELILLQIRQIQEELETYYIRAKEAESRLEHQALLLRSKEDEIISHQGKLLSLEKGHQSLEKTTAELRTKIEEMEQAVVESGKKVHEKNEENKILFLQLNQAHEELDIYFQRYQELLSAKSEPEQDQANNPFEARMPITPEPTKKSGLMRTYLEKHKSSRKLKQQIMLIQHSGLFDEQWYLREYADVAGSGMEPIRHYLKFGADEGRDPSLKFDTSYYMRSNPDLLHSTINPLIHYISHGKEEGRKPHP